MDLTALIASLGEDEPPAALSPGLLALWHEAKGDWEKAHGVVQIRGDAESAWVHAYLHRVEGDHSNAAYWYRRAEKPVSSADPADEWGQIATEILSA